MDRYANHLNQIGALLYNIGENVRQNTSIPHSFSHIFHMSNTKLYSKSILHFCSPCYLELHILCISISLYPLLAVLSFDFFPHHEICKNPKLGTAFLLPPISFVIVLKLLMPHSYNRMNSVQGSSCCMHEMQLLVPISFGQPFHKMSLVCGLDLP